MQFLKRKKRGKISVNYRPYSLGQIENPQGGRECIWLNHQDYFEKCDKDSTSQKNIKGRFLGKNKEMNLKPS